ncbi:type II toxin-antitoxin system PemK/MazF family toxin [Geodermatophilus sp. SYSU D00703]
MARTGIVRRLAGVLRAVAQPATRAARGTRRARSRVPASPRAGGSGVRDLDGGLTGVDLDYRPRPDDRPDPGEVVWAWVPFDEGDGRGKDRPVLVVGRRGADLLVGLMLSSRDHDVDAADEARHGRYWLDVGRGAWDPQGRPSEARLDRLLEVPAAAARRMGAALDRARFDAVVAAVREFHGA